MVMPAPMPLAFQRPPATELPALNETTAAAGIIQGENIVQAELQKAAIRQQQGEQAAAQQQLEAERNAAGMDAIGPAEPIATALGEGANSLEREAVDLYQQGNQYTTFTKANPMYPAVKEYVGDQRAAQAEGVEAAVGPEGMQQAQTQNAEALVQMQRDLEARNTVELAAQYDRQRKQQQALSEQVKAGEAAVTNAKKLSDEYNSMAEVDPRRGWTSKTGAQKFFAVLATALIAAGGHSPTEAMAHIRGAIQDDIDAQKAAIGKKGQAVGFANEHVDATFALQQRVREQYSDENTQALAIETARLMQAEQAFDRLASEAGLRELPPAQRAFRAELAKQVADNNLRLAKMEAFNAPTISKRVYTGPLTAKIMEKLGDAKLKQAGESRQQSGQLLGAAGLKAAENSMSGGEQSPQQQKAEFEQMKYLSDNTKKTRNRLRAINSFRKKYGADVPGVSFASRFIPGQVPKQMLDQAGRDARAELKRIYLSRLREETGAAYNTKEEFDAAEGYIDSFDEGDVFAELDRQEASDVQSVQDVTRAVKPEIAAKWYGATPEMMPHMPSDTTGLEKSDSMPWASKDEGGPASEAKFGIADIAGAGVRALTNPQDPAGALSMLPGVLDDDEEE